MEDELAGNEIRGAGVAESQCIIHIGMHKTGSTSIQRSLHGLDNDRLFYARLAGTPNHSLPIYSAFAGVPERHHLHRSAGRDQRRVQRYNDRIYRELDLSIEAARGRTLIISGEDISSLHKRDLLKLREYFSPRFGKLSIVGYVRSPAGFLASSFQQRVKSGALNSFDLMRMYRSYRATFEKFDNVFGRDRVQLWKFDSGMFPDGDVVSDFSQRLGISLPHTTPVRLNESLSSQAVATFYIYNKFGKHAGTSLLRRAGGAALVRLLDGDKFRLSPDSVRPVMEHNRADIEWMEERLGQPLREELGEHRDADVRDENDLLRPDTDAVAKLLTMLGRSAPSGVTGHTPQEIAALVDAIDRKQRYRDVAWWWRSISRTLASLR